MEGFKMEAGQRPEIAFAKESPGVWERIVGGLTEKLAEDIAAPMKYVDDIKMEAIRAAIEKEVPLALADNADVLNGETISWSNDMATAEDPEKAEKMKTKRLREILDKKSGGDFSAMLSGKIR